MCCCSSVNGTGVAGTAEAGGVEGPAIVGEGAPLLVAVVALASSVDTTGAEAAGGGVWDCDKGDGPGNARPEGPGKLKELGPGRASPFDGCDGCWD